MQVADYYLLVSSIPATLEIGIELTLRKDNSIHDYHRFLDQSEKLP